MGSRHKSNDTFGNRHKLNDEDDEDSQGFTSKTITASTDNINELHME